MSKRRPRNDTFPYTTTGGPTDVVIGLYMVSTPDEWVNGAPNTGTITTYPVALTEADVRRIIREELKRHRKKQRKRKDRLFQDKDSK
jgi:hypothetical protein